MTLQTLWTAHQAQLAADGIPLHFGDLLSEYHAPLRLMDRSHEGRIVVSGPDRHAFFNRMSTNNTLNMQAGDGITTIFTNPNARILFRVAAYERGQDLLVITQPGQGPAFADFLRRNIFFNDQVTVEDISANTHQIALHGEPANAVISQLVDATPAGALGWAGLSGIDGHALLRKPIDGGHWALVLPQADALTFTQQLISDHEPTLAGSLTYNTLRIRAGLPAGRELSADYLPLEVGLWDEVSFSKGCYTGQEIIARMESRGRLARNFVHLKLDAMVAAPAEISSDGQLAGTLTSSVEAPDGAIFALAVLKTAFTAAGTQLSVDEGGAAAQVIGFAGSQPAFVTSS